MSQGSGQPDAPRMPVSPRERAALARRLANAVTRSDDRRLGLLELAFELKMAADDLEDLGWCHQDASAQATDTTRSMIGKRLPTFKRDQQTNRNQP